MNRQFKRVIGVQNNKSVLTLSAPEAYFRRQILESIPALKEQTIYNGCIPVT